MRRKVHVRFGERAGRDRQVKARFGAPVPTLRAPTPSREDVAFTKRLAAAGEVVGVRLLDHLIVGANRRWASLRRLNAW